MLTTATLLTSVLDRAKTLAPGDVVPPSGRGKVRERGLLAVKQVLTIRPHSRLSNTSQTFGKFVEKRWGTIRKLAELIDTANEESVKVWGRAWGATSRNMGACTPLPPPPHTRPNNRDARFSIRARTNTWS